jgi:uncharacterized protein (DUF924 family)
MIDLASLQSAITRFSDFWFPNDKPTQPFWFRARDAKFRDIVSASCDDFYPPIDTITKTVPNVQSFLSQLFDAGYSDQELIVLSIMLDQVPRNTLAVGWGRFADADPKNVRASIDDSFSLAFATAVRGRVKLSAISDHRIICFFSLVFRHSDKFNIAREVLLSLSPSSDKPDTSAPGVDVADLCLPALAQKFWQETDKRQKVLES